MQLQHNFSQKQKRRIQETKDDCVQAHCTLRHTAAPLIIKLFSVAIKGKETTTGNDLIFLFQLIHCFSKERNITKCATKYLWENLYISSVLKTLYQLSNLTKKGGLTF
jgi:hypothetical protein